MLSRLSIRNYALIDDLDISFSKDLNILTGETGAGKSIILGALSLILGQRTESKYFFTQQKKCIIEGFFKIADYHISDFFDSNDLDYEEETVLRREISADGKSRAFINDTSVTLSVLKQLGEQLIDIHSQHATLEINDEGFQLQVVDTLANHGQLLEQYRHTFKSYQQAKSRLNILTEESDKAKAEVDYLQFQFDELEKANLQNDEEILLEQELNTLNHAEEIKRNLAGSVYLLNEQEQSVLQQLKECIIQLQQASRYNPGIATFVERVQSAAIELRDIADEVEQVEQQTFFNESRSSEISQRLDLIFNLQQKHRVASSAELISIREELSEKLSSILFADEEIEKLKTEARKLHAELSVFADNLTASRNEIIPFIESKVRETLALVGMPNAALKIENPGLPQGQFNLNGKDSIQFLFSANKGQNPAPMNKVASGGELSRLMLSIKSLISRHASLPTIIFDEIDTGISGEVALKVGAVMEHLAQSMQVIAITHLPQIASKGTSHYRVYKDDRNDRTLTGIKLLNREERIHDIAEMLSGKNPGESALQNAKELLG